MMNYTLNWIWNICSSFTCIFFIVNDFFFNQSDVLSYAVRKLKATPKTHSSFQSIFSFMLIIPVWLINWLIMSLNSPSVEKVLAYLLSPEARACSLAHIAHSIFPIALTFTDCLHSAGAFRERLTLLIVSTRKRMYLWDLRCVEEQAERRG